MKYADSEVGMLVRRVSTGRRYRIIGQRVMATDAGAYVVDLDPNGSGIHDSGIVHWSDLEPLTDAEAD